MTPRMPQTEACIQGAIIQALRLLGYTVLMTSRNRRRCYRCGAYSNAGDGCDRGIPDLLVSLGDGRWLGLEVKGPKTRLSTEQTILATDRRIIVVRSVEDALQAVSQACPASPAGRAMILDGYEQTYTAERPIPQGNVEA